MQPTSRHVLAELVAAALEVVVVLEVVETALDVEALGAADPIFAW